MNQNPNPNSKNQLKITLPPSWTTINENAMSTQSRVPVVTERPLLSKPVPDAQLEQASAELYINNLKQNLRRLTEDNDALQHDNFAKSHAITTAENYIMKLRSSPAERFGQVIMAIDKRTSQIDQNLGVIYRMQGELRDESRAAASVHHTGESLKATMTKENSEKTTTIECLGRTTTRMAEVLARGAGCTSDEISKVLQENASLRAEAENLRSQVSENHKNTSQMQQDLDRERSTSKSVLACYQRECWSTNQQQNPAPNAYLPTKRIIEVTNQELAAQPEDDQVPGGKRLREESKVRATRSKKSKAN